MMSDSRFEHVLNQVERVSTLGACSRLVQPLREAWNQRLGVTNGKHLLSDARARVGAVVGRTLCELSAAEIQLCFLTRLCFSGRMFVDEVN